MKGWEVYVFKRIGKWVKRKIRRLRDEVREDLEEIGITFDELREGVDAAASEGIGVQLDADQTRDLASAFRKYDRLREAAR